MDEWISYIQEDSNLHRHRQDNLKPDQDTIVILKPAALTQLPAEN